MRASGRLLTTLQRRRSAPATEIHYLPAPASCAPWWCNDEILSALESMPLVFHVYCAYLNSRYHYV